MLDDLPSLGGPKSKKPPAVNNDFDDFGFEDDYADKKGKDKFSKAQQQLMDYEEEENTGYNMRVKAPGK